MKAIQATRHLCGTVFDFLIPPLCLSCHSPIGNIQSLCGSCWSQLCVIDEPRCAVWGEPFAFDQGADAVSGRAMANSTAWTQLRAAVVFNDQAARIIHALKYHDRLETAEFMARMMYRTSREVLGTGSILVPVPLHRWRLWRRRYNQAALLAKTLAELSGASMGRGLLIRHRATPSQVGLKQQEREANVERAFSVPEAARKHVEGSDIVLVDDVVTTGATAKAAAQALAEAGARRISVVAFALVLLPTQTHI